MSASGTLRPRIFAFYFPHYCGLWQGPTGRLPGFSPWHLVASARPLFGGHDQPRVPADLGFYDLRVQEVRLAQADLAGAYGIDGFCYLHYWSEGKRLFERPFEEVVASGTPDFPFCLCWMNEDFPSLGFAQAYSATDDRAHADFVAGAFADARYLRLDGRPVFVVRRPGELSPNGATIEAIRRASVSRGLGEPLMIAASRDAERRDARAAGFDLALDWPEAPRARAGVSANLHGFCRRAVANLRRGRLRSWLEIYDESRWRAIRAKRVRPAHHLSVATVGRDDTPAEGAAGTVLDRRAPSLFEAELREALAGARRAPLNSRLIFVDSWNDWVGGASLEPDQRFGRAYLRSVARARLSDMGAREISSS